MSPRFVHTPVLPGLGNPTGQDWVSETKVNNGGLRWLKEKVAELSEE